MPDITIAIRMDSENKNILDYYLLPTLDIESSRLKLSDNNGLALDAYRFDDLEHFFYMAQRAKIKEVA